MFDLFTIVGVITENDDICEDEFGNHVLCDPFSHIIWFITTQYVFDVIPIAAILLFHHYNFKSQMNETITETMSMSL